MARRRGTPSFRVDYSGPFFDRDPVKTLSENITAMMDALAKEAERDVRGRILANAGRMPYSTGHTAGTIRGRTESLSGKRWRRTLRVSADTSGMSRKDAIRTKAAAASIEARFHPFRRAAGAIKRSRTALAANLIEGIE